MDEGRAGHLPEPREIFLKHPWNFLALGAGSGLVAVAPGTFGSLAAVPLALLLPPDVIGQVLLILLTFFAGVRFCNHCTEALGVHDHGAIVWDEWVGFFIAMLAVPRSLSTVVLAFALFRFFDIVKPWPIGIIDNKVRGGFGIMIDDVIAGIMACTMLHAALNLGLLSWV